jgi:hypothetical protein
MIIFDFDAETGSNRTLFWLGCTNCDGEDKEHSDEIYEQLDAEICGLTAEFGD